MLELEPILATFPIIGIHKTVGVYSILRFKPMYNLSLEVGSLFKKCLLNMLSDGSRKTFAIKTASGSSKTFKSVERSYFPSRIIFFIRFPNAACSLRCSFGFSKMSADKLA